MKGEGEKEEEEGRKKKKKKKREVHTVVFQFYFSTSSQLWKVMSVEQEMAVQLLGETLVITME